MKLHVAIVDYENFSNFHCFILTVILVSLGVGVICRGHNVPSYCLLFVVKCWPNRLKFQNFVDLVIKSIIWGVYCERLIVSWAIPFVWRTSHELHTNICMIKVSSLSVDRRNVKLHPAIVVVRWSALIMDCDCLWNILFYWIFLGYRRGHKRPSYIVYCFHVYSCNKYDIKNKWRILYL